MARQLDIFILMAGQGERFRLGGHSQPKPLIEFKGKPIFAWGLKTLKELLPDSNLHLVLCAEDGIHDKVELALTGLKDLKFHTVHIINLPKRTNGPLETAIQAVRQTAANENSNPVLFCDCDVYFESLSWLEAVNKFKKGESGLDGLLVTFDSNLEKYSYVKINSENCAVAVAEKKVISNTAVTGAYLFKERKLFLQSGNKVLEDMSGGSNERYISHVYNQLIAEGKKIGVVKADKIVQLGTPEELKESEDLI